MLKRKHSRLSILSLLLSVAMLLSCLTVVMIPSSAEGATYESDEAAVAAGYVFRVDGLYYQTLAESYDAVANDGTIYMIGDYNHTGSCMDIGANAVSVKTYTINGGGFTYTSAANHAIHFQNSNVTVDGMNYTMTGTSAGPRIDQTSTLTLKNATWVKTTKSGGWWQPAVIVYGSLVLDEGAVIKSNNADSDKNSHAVYTEKKTNTPVVIVKENAIIEAKLGNCFYERHAADITIANCNVTLSSSGAIRGGDEKALSKITMSGPSAAELEDPVATEKWKALYAKMGQEWGTADIAQIGETKYSTLTAAFRAATNGCMVKLLSNVALDGTVSFTSDTPVSFTLDGSGFTVSGGNYTLLSLGENVTCTIKNITFSGDNYETGTGVLDLAGADVTLEANTKIINGESVTSSSLGNSTYVGISSSKSGSKLTINNGALIDVAGTALKSDVGNSSDITINGGTVKTKNRGYISNATSKLTINSGKLVSTCTNINQVLMQCYNSKTDISIYGGELSTVKAPIFNNSTKGTLVVIGGTFTVGTETYTVNTLDSYSLSLNDDIGINFYAALSDNETKLSATLPNGKVVAMRLSDANQKTAKFGLLNLYRFTVNVSAADMTAEIPVKLEAAGNTDDVTVSIVRYAKQILSDNAYSESAKALVTAMLHYGAAAQTFFEKNPDNLANKDLTAPDFSAITVAASYAPSVTGSAEGLTYFGSSLLLKGKTVIRHYFRLADGKSISDYQFKLGETVLTATQYKDTELYFVEITGIKSSDLTTAYTVTVGDLTVTYSAMSYAYTALTAEGVDDTLAATVKALVNYANAAKTYFAAN